MSDEEPNINDTLRTLIRGAIAIVIVLGFFYLLWSSPAETDYEKCINKCPYSNWKSEFTNLECPKMCAELKEIQCKGVMGAGIITFGNIFGGFVLIIFSLGEKRKIKFRRIGS